MRIYDGLIFNVLKKIIELNFNKLIFNYRIVKTDQYNLNIFE